MWILYIGVYMVRRHFVQSCCGGKGYLFELDKPVTRESIQIFIREGYVTSEVYLKVGVFHIQRQGLIASGPFGGTKIQVRCNGAANCHLLLDHLENTFNLS